jgi:hypothetical protein
MESTNAHASVQIRQVARIFSGAAAHQLNAAHSGQLTPLLSVRALRDGGIDSGEVEEIRIHDPVRLTAYATHEGDVVVAARGTQLKVAMVRKDVAGAILGATLIAIRTGLEIQPEVVLAYLRGISGQAALGARLRSATGQVALTARDVGEIEIPLPSAEVQQIIVKTVRAAGEYATASREAVNLRERLLNDMVHRLLIEGEPAHG